LGWSVDEAHQVMHVPYRLRALIQLAFCVPGVFIDISRQLCWLFVLIRIRSYPRILDGYTANESY